VEQLLAALYDCDKPLPDRALEWRRVDELKKAVSGAPGPIQEELF
jgi:hypothetical protein